MIGFDAIEYASLSDVGVRRSHNQDALAVLAASEEAAWSDRGNLFLVADGMGAHAVGELASKLATDLIPHTYQKHAAGGAAEALRRAFGEANASIHARGQQNPEFEGMGTTSTALLLRKEGAWVGHVGDSRAYRIRAGQIEQLSYDHSLHWELARRQKIHPDQLEGIPSNVIVRSLGPEATVEVDVEGPHPILLGDAYLVCSDGLSGQVTDNELGAVVSVLPPKEACRFLVDLANLRGGPDNITLVLIRVAGEPPGSSVEVAVEPAARPRWLSQATWPPVALGAGVVLAIVALVLLLLKYSAGTYLASFSLAVLALLGGLIGLVRNYRKEQNGAHPAPNGPPRVYRQTKCRIETTLLQNLVQAGGTLEMRAREKNWEVNWDQHRQHMEASRTAQEQNDLVAAFREQCRAMALLTGALRRQRNKGEIFQPVWEREPD